MAYVIDNLITSLEKQRDNAYAKLSAPGTDDRELWAATAIHDTLGMVLDELNKINKAGNNTCAHCGSSNINYHAVEIDNELVCCPIHCYNCGKHSIEYYDTVYLNTVKEES